MRKSKKRWTVEVWTEGEWQGEAVRFKRRVVAPSLNVACEWAKKYERSGQEVVSINPEEESTSEPGR